MKPMDERSSVGLDGGMVFSFSVTGPVLGALPQIWLLEETMGLAVAFHIPVDALDRSLTNTLPSISTARPAFDPLSSP